MARNSKIEWTHHTFNPWWGCQKVSPACRSCYAEAWAKRTGHGVWGAKAPRRFFSDSHWRQPKAWNREAEQEGARFRVFCASMADVFEDLESLTPWRERLWEMVEETPQLDWLLLTKRIELAGEMLPWGADIPENVWIGTTVENQEWAEKRVPELVKIPAAVRFLSCEPLLGPLDLTRWARNLSWVIAGGETGGKSRPSDPMWFRNLRDQCVESGMKFHFKQWGDWFPLGMEGEGARTRTWEAPSGETVVRAGKKATGRTLDGRQWDEIPQASRRVA